MIPDLIFARDSLNDIEHLESLADELCLIEYFYVIYRATLICG